MGIEFEILVIAQIWLICLLVFLVRDVIKHYINDDIKQKAQKKDKTNFCNFFKKFL